MRDLTQEEIDNAPEWATHYMICNDDRARYKGLSLGGDSHNYQTMGNLLVLTMSYGYKSIPVKDFDINSHSFGEKQWYIDGKVEPQEELAICDDKLFDDYAVHYEFIINKEDAAALAKHFKLTVEDLK